MPRLRPLTPLDVSTVVELNAANVAALAPMGEARLAELTGLADRFDVVELDGQVAGFVVTFRPGTSYDSPNYRWCTQTFGDRFYYLDRIVFADDFRRRGLGTFVYDEVERVAAPYGRLLLEVNAVPPNHGSLAFHAGRGFTEVGRLDVDGKVVSFLEKELGEGRAR